MKFVEYQDDFISSKFGIEAKISTNNKRFKHCSFTVYADGDRISVSPSLSDGKGKPLGSLEFFKSKYSMDELEGTKLFDAIEETINQFIDGAISYITGLFNCDKLEPIQIAGVKKISWLLYYISKKMDVAFNYPSNLKSKKGTKEALHHIHSVLLLIISNNKYDSVFNISQHMIKPYRNDDFGLYEADVFIDAESYFNGSYDKAKNALMTKRNNEIKEAEHKGKSLLMGLAQGEVAISDFDAS